MTSQVPPLADNVQGYSDVKHRMRAAVATGVALAAWSWALLRRLAMLRTHRPTEPERHRETRRSYAFGAISRQTFEAAMRKTRWSSIRDRRPGAK